MTDFTHSICELEHAKVQPVCCSKFPVQSSSEKGYRRPYFLFCAHTSSSSTTSDIRAAVFNIRDTRLIYIATTNTAVIGVEGTYIRYDHNGEIDDDREKLDHFAVATMISSELAEI